MVAMGGPVDNWSREPGMPLAMGDPHPDALVIEGQLNDLCEALKLAADGAGPCPLDLTPYTIDDRLKGQADLGVMISAALHATPRWLTGCAIHGGAPEVGDGPECQPVKSSNGKITLWREEVAPCGFGPDGRPWFTTSHVVAVSKGDARDTGLFCKLHWTRTGFDWIESQLRYAFWHAALVHLVPGLQFLTSVEVLPPVAPATPWLDAPVEAGEPLLNATGARRARLEDRLRPGMRHGSRYQLDERRPVSRRTVRRRASPVRHLDPTAWTPSYPKQIVAPAASAVHPIPRS